MQCRACEHDNRPEARFCESCGAPLVVTCGDCGAELRPEAKFCDACGKPQSSSSRDQEQERQPRPQHIAEAIQRDHGTMEGERRVVTVLFADAVGHTPIAEQLDEEEVYNLMQGCFERMQESVWRYEGTVNQFTGDGILALFGAPIAHEDSARRAVAAALDMQQSLGEYATEVMKRHPIQCSYRVGLNTGPVVVGKISDNLDLDFAAVGDTVNLAARMESMAESGTVYLTENTFRAVKDFIECDRLGELQVKGKNQPVVAYRAVRETQIRQRLDAAAAHGLTPYVGRERELNILIEYLEQARRGQGQIVYVSGEAGLGKSRLLLEFRKAATESGAKWLEGHCASHARTTPYLPFIDIVKSEFNVQEDDNDESIIERVETTTANWPEELRASIPYLRFLLNVDPGDETVATMDPMERRAGVFEALRALIQWESADEPLVLVIEDLHWIDEKSEESLTALVDTLAGRPILLVLTSRPGYTHQFGDRSYFSRLALGHLQSGDSANIVESVLGTESLPTQLLDLIARKAEGNPFYIEEVTKSLMESGALSHDNGSYTLERPIESVSVPDTIQEVILARIDRLDRASKGAMQLASVIGREFTGRLLRRIADIESELDEVLQELKGLELIYETGFSPELSYMFKHALTHDVAYSTLLLERRRTLHRVVAMSIEELYSDRLPEHYEALAHHYEEAQIWEKALDYLEKAGDKAVGAYANQNAIDYYGGALSVCERLGESENERSLAIAERRGWVHFMVADYKGAIEDADRILAIGLEQKAETIEARALTLRGIFETYDHEFEASEASFQRAAELSEKHAQDDVLYMSRVGIYAIQKLTDRHGEASEQAALVEQFPEAVSEPFVLSYWTFFSALDKNWRGDFEGAIRQSSTWRQLPASTPQVMILHVRWSEALTLAGMGRYTEALNALADIAAECERIGEIAVRARANNSIGWILGDLQSHSESMEYSHRGVEVALLEGDEPEKISNARLNWADSLMALQRYDEAQVIFEEVEGVIRNPRPQDRWMLWRFSQHFFHSYGKLHSTRESFDAAIALADECLELAERSDSKKYIVKARRLRGEALLGLGDTGGAVRESEIALQNAQAVKNPPQLWKSFALLGNSLQSDNRESEAAQAFRRASSVIDEVARGLADEALQQTLLQSHEVQTIRRWAE